MTGERTLPGAGLTGYWNLGDSSWKPGMDTNLRAVSALLQLTVKTRTTALPGSPAQGDMHLVPSGASVSPNQIALYDSAAWVYVAPRLGTRAFVQDESKFYYWTGTAWVEESDASATVLAGDVTGTAGASVVVKIQGIPVSTTDPTTNQVLKFDGTNWAPAADASATAVTMAGDVTGPSGTSVVVAFQGRALASTAPSDGQAIVWDATGTTWKPATVASGSTSPLTTKGDLYTYTTLGARLGVGTNGQILTADSTQASGLKWVAPSYDLPVYIPDKPTTSMICARIAVVRAFDLPVSLTGSVASAGTAATASTVFTLYKNTTSIGTVTFAAAGTTGTFSFASAVSFAAGDVVRIIAPATADTTLADISITLMGSRT